MASQISFVSIGVADMAPVRELWVNQLGLHVLADKQGEDEQLARLWNVPADQIVSQLLLNTPGASSGYLHFVQFKAPAESVRQGAATTDHCAKNIDINCTDMPAVVARLKAAGYEFRSVVGEYEIEGLHVREVQMPVHDDLNVVLIEVLDESYALPFTPQGCAGLTSFVIIVPDVAAETAFYKQTFGLTEMLQHKLSGPALEAAAGLPEGAVLDLHLLGQPNNLFGRVELIEYVGVPGADLFERAVAPATGILHIGFVVSSLADLKQKLDEQGIVPLLESEVSILPVAGAMLEFITPAGLRALVFEAK